MAKRGGFPGGMGGFGGMNIGNLMKEAKKMQADMEKTQTQLTQMEFTATAGGGAVTAVIKEEVVDPDDVEMLEDLVLTCLNDAFNQVDNKQSEQMGKFNIPGLM